MKKKIIILLIIAAVCVWIAWGNTALQVTEITISSENIPPEFSGFRIAQVSDLHNAEFGEDNEKLLDMLSDTDPDVIVITGDIVDSRRTDIDVAIEFARGAAQITRTYYVTGNHEARIEEYEELREGLSDAGVILLSNKRVFYEQSGEHIVFVGIDDPQLFRSSYTKQLRALSEQNGYTILLSHRPEWFEKYAECGYDLVLTGHAHGGQIRIPFIGGVMAPNQGLFPKYDAGLYTIGETNMVVSRGIGNSIFPFRVNNRPEIVVVELESL